MEEIRKAVDEFFANNCRDSVRIMRKYNIDAQDFWDEFDARSGHVQQS